MDSAEKSRHIRNICRCIKMSVPSYVADDFVIHNIPTPQRAGTMTQQETYASITAVRVFEEFIKKQTD